MFHFLLISYIKDSKIGLVFVSFLQDFLAELFSVSVYTYQKFECNFENSTKIHENNLSWYTVEQLGFTQPEFEFT